MEGRTGSEDRTDVVPVTPTLCRILPTGSGPGCLRRGREWGCGRRTGVARVRDFSPWTVTRRSGTATDEEGVPGEEGRVDEPPVDLET